MALTNTQYESIIREYEEKQLRSRHLLEKRLAHIRNTYPEYAALEDLSASLASSFTKRLIDGEEGARAELSASLQSLSRKKEEFLSEKGFPPHYLEPVYECGDCKDTIALKTGSHSCSITRVISPAALSRRTFIRCPMNIFQVRRFRTTKKLWISAKALFLPSMKIIAIFYLWAPSAQERLFSPTVSPKP